uniref:Uncharacterized protein n=1 Tax=Chrysemys picta bellii TaxID=8478 RepID=A0A8C3IYB2_CHRPI
MRIFPVLFWILLKGYFQGLAALELTGPEAVSGLWGRSVSVPCQYHEGYQETPKYWCSGITWQSCSKVVETTGSEAEVTRGRVSIRDNHTLRVFTVTMENLTLEDTGIYWCGINLRSKSDFNSPVSVTVLQGESTFNPLHDTSSHRWRTSPYVVGFLVCSRSFLFNLLHMGWE